jgi:hypothetical protein
MRPLLRGLVPARSGSTARLVDWAVAGLSPWATNGLDASRHHREETRGVLAPAASGCGPRRA